MGNTGDQEAVATVLAAICARLEAVAKSRAAANQPFERTVAAGSALARIIERFGLSDFEANILILVAAVELHQGVGPLCAHIDEAKRPYPTFALALSIFPDPDWAAVLPEAPLRRGRLVQLGPGEVLSQRPLYIDERVLNALLGHTGIDPALERRMVPATPPAVDTPTHAAVARALATQLEHDPERLVQLEVNDETVGLAIAALACSRHDLQLWHLDARAIPSNAEEREELVRLWSREAKLGPVALALSLPHVVDPDLGHRVVEFCERLEGPRVTLAAEPPVDPAAARFEVGEPTFADRVALWRGALGHAPEGEYEAMIHRLATQFDIGGPALTEIVERVRGEGQLDAAELEGRLWAESRLYVRPKMADLAQRVDVRSTLDQLILPDSQRDMLDALISQVRQRATVFHGWGFDRFGRRGAGTTAIFAGPSGTGKTMAAEGLADALDLDLYRIDLSAVVSKYIGETEENLRKVFDAAEAGGSVLLFDEADALFGKRTEIRDSHDRHANIEVSYLLQRMEAYRGLAILTTNMRKSIDEAFLRRVQFIIDFPFPAAEQREAIWSTIFPDQTPLGELDYAKLARLSVAGGNIRSIARNAAYLAADDEQADRVEMRHLLAAARIEYAKLARSLPPSEIRGWVESAADGRRR